MTEDQINLTAFLFRVAADHADQLMHVMIDLSGFLLIETPLSDHYRRSLGQIIDKCRHLSDERITWAYLDGLYLRAWNRLYAIFRQCLQRGFVLRVPRGTSTSRVSKQGLSCAFNRSLSICV